MSPENIKKTSGFFIFSGGVERDQRHKMSYCIPCSKDNTHSYQQTYLLSLLSFFFFLNFFFKSDIFSSSISEGFRLINSNVSPGRIQNLVKHQYQTFFRLVSDFWLFSQKSSIIDVWKSSKENSDFIYFFWSLYFV